MLKSMLKKAKSFKEKDDKEKAEKKQRKLEKKLEKKQRKLEKEGASSSKEPGMKQLLLGCFGSGRRKGGALSDDECEGSYAARALPPAKWEAEAQGPPALLQLPGPVMDQIIGSGVLSNRDRAALRQSCHQLRGQVDAALRRAAAADPLTAPTEGLRRLCARFYPAGCLHKMRRLDSDRYQHSADLAALLSLTAVSLCLRRAHDLPDLRPMARVAALQYTVPGPAAAGLSAAHKASGGFNGLYILSGASSRHWAA